MKSSKINSVKILIYLLVLIIAVWGILEIVDYAKGRTLRDSLGKIDGSQVDKIKVVDQKNPSQEILLEKKEGRWQMQVSSTQWVKVDSVLVHAFLDQVGDIKTTHLSSKNKADHATFEVADNQGIHVTLYKGNTSLLSVIIGSFYALSQEEMYTYVRLSGENDVFASPGLLSTQINTNRANWRNSLFTSFKREETETIIFLLPNNKYVVSFNGKNWFMNNQRIPVKQVRKYLKALEQLNYTYFMDSIPLSSFGEPYCSVKILNDIVGEITINGYKDAKGQWYLTSTQNPEAVFQDKDKLAEKVFKAEGFFLE